MHNWYTSLPVDAMATNGPSCLWWSLDLGFKTSLMTRSPSWMPPLAVYSSRFRDNHFITLRYLSCISDRYFSRFWTCSPAALISTSVTGLEAINVEAKTSSVPCQRAWSAGVYGKRRELGEYKYSSLSIMTFFFWDARLSTNAHPTHSRLQIWSVHMKSLLIYSKTSYVPMVNRYRLCMTTEKSSEARNSRPVAKSMEFDPPPNTPGHPQTNSKVERLNYELVQ